MSRPVRVYNRSVSGTDVEGFAERSLELEQLRPTGDKVKIPRGWPDTEAIEFEESDRTQSARRTRLWIGRESMELVDGPRWPRDSDGTPIPPAHLSLPSKCSWVASTIRCYLDDTDLLFLQMALETLDDLRAARERGDVDRAIRFANEFRRQGRHLRFEERYIEGHLENPDWIDPWMVSPEWD